MYLKSKLPCRRRAAYYFTMSANVDAGASTDPVNTDANLVTPKQEDFPSSKYDPDVIVKGAEAKRDANDIAGAQMLYQQALLDWVDDAREGTDLGLDPTRMREAIATLWIAYANLSRQAQMYKSASEAYEAAVNCPISGSVGRIWLEYARFQEERGRHKSAQKVYLRALVGDETSSAGVPDEQEQALLWNEFLRMIRELNHNPSLSLEELRSGVEKEYASSLKQNRRQNEEGDSGPTTNADNAPSETTPSPKPDDASAFKDPPAKRMRLNKASEGTPKKAADMVSEAKNVHLVTAKTVEAEAATLLNATQGMPPELTAAWLARDGDTQPSRPEPPLFTPSPPKLGDASGKEILGDELALTLIRMLLKKSDDDNAGAILLEVCRACWMMTAMKEQQAAKSIDALDRKMTADMDALEANLEARLTVAGAAASAVQQMNENERQEVLASCNQQRQQLMGYLAWEFRQLLASQQQLLTKVKLPCFDGPTVDASLIEMQARVCSFMHSAFYLRARIGDAQHLAMLKSQVERLSVKRTLTPPPTSRPAQKKIAPAPATATKSSRKRNPKPRAQPAVGNINVQVPSVSQAPLYLGVPQPSAFRQPLYQHEQQPLAPPIHLQTLPAYQQQQPIQQFQQIDQQQQLIDQQQQFAMFSTQPSQPSQQLFSSGSMGLSGSSVHQMMMSAQNPGLQMIPPPGPQAFASQHQQQHQQQQILRSHQQQGQQHPPYNQHQHFPR